MHNENEADTRETNIRAGSNLVRDSDLISSGIGLLILGGIYLTSHYSFLLFHSIAELFCIVVAFSIFVIAWNSRKIIENNYLLFIGISYLFIALLDTLHTLAYKGMGVFQGYDANLPTQLWIASRYLDSAAFFMAPFFLTRKLRARFLISAEAALVALVLASIFAWGIFPDCYVEGTGLTPFKKASEYVICIILLLSFLHLYRRKDYFDANVFRLLSASIFLTVSSELFFTFYISVYGISNLTGHILKISAYYLLYRAIVVTGLKEPYRILFRELKQSENALRQERDRARQYLDIAGVMIVALDTSGNISLINKKGSEILKAGGEDLAGRSWFDNFVPENIRTDLKRLFNELIMGRTGSVMKYHEYPILTTDRDERLIMFHHTVISNRSGDAAGLLFSGEDITERRSAEEEKERLIAQLQEALSRVKTLSGLLPICASCKKVRDDKGYWNQIEVYVRDHSDAEFSHSICPDCSARLYGNFMKKQGS